MSRILLLLALPLFFSCGQSAGRTIGPQNASTEKAEHGKEQAALQFINSYVDYCNDQQQKPVLVDWADANKLVTARFRKELRKIVVDANREDPELGLGFDPIFDAQDYPDAGFTVEASGKETDFMVVKGKDWPDFKLTVKVVRENGKWLVDGCGIVNVPEEYRVLR